MNGRQKCSMMNQIRRKVADANGIDFVIYECTFEGECTGRCQKSDSELNYLEEELEKRQNTGEKLNFRGVFTLGEEKERKSDPEEVSRKMEKLQEIMKNPELSDLPPRYLDKLLY